METKKSNRQAEAILKHEGYFVEKFMESYQNMAKIADIENLHDGEFGLLLNDFCMNMLFKYFRNVNLGHEGGLEYIRLFASTMCYGWDAACEE